MALADCEEGLRAVLSRHDEISDDALAGLLFRLGNEVQTGEGR